MAGRGWRSHPGARCFAPPELSITGFSESFYPVTGLTPRAFSSASVHRYSLTSMSSTRACFRSLVADQHVLDTGLL